MKAYEITEIAGQWVAGKRVNHGDVIHLTDAQAKYELMRGLIRPAGAAASAASEASKERRSRRPR